MGTEEKQTVKGPDAISEELYAAVANLGRDREQKIVTASASGEEGLLRLFGLQARRRLFRRTEGSARSRFRTDGGYPASSGGKGADRAQRGHGGQPQGCCTHHGAWA